MREEYIYLCFIEYEKAFDRVKHEKIIESMENLDLDGKDINMIRNMYWNHKAYMRRVVTGNSHQKRSTTMLCVVILSV